MWNSSSLARSKKRGSYQQRPPAIDEEATEALFAEIADEDDPSVAGMEGISKLCEKLDIDPLEDIRILVLLWKLGSKEKPAQISKEEWISGCQTLQVDSIDKFKELLPSLDLGFLDQTDFRDFYKVCVFILPKICCVLWVQYCIPPWNNLTLSRAHCVHDGTDQTFSFAFVSICIAHIGRWTRKWSWP